MIGKLINIFTKREVQKFLLLFVAIFISGLLEVVGVASILPFMELIAKPTAISDSTWLTWLFELGNFDNERQMIIYFGIAIIVLIGLTSAFTLLTIWMQLKFSWQANHNLGIRLLRNYLEKPYSYFLSQNTPELQAYIMSETAALTNGIIISAIEFISKAFISIIIFGLLFLVDPSTSLIMFIGLGGSYVIVYMIKRKFLKKIGEYRVEMNLLRYKSLTELLQGIKSINVYDAKAFFYNRYQHASNEFSDVQPKFQFVMVMPKFFLEFIAFGGILAVTMYLYSSGGNIQSAIPRLSLFAVAGYRILPALQKAFSAATKFRLSMPVLDRLYGDLVNSLQYTKPLHTKNELLLFENHIKIKGLNFRYNTSESPVLNDINLIINKGETVAFIGSTGSGKTTLIDILVGLLYQTKGDVLIDGVALTPKRAKSWQRNIAYVSQDVFLFDDTIMNNITFGQDAKLISIPDVEKAAAMADILTFIEKELPNGFDTMIGERGIRLSGGQKQRISLARAIYRQPEILVLDEATSALDSITEKSVIESIETLPINLTTIIIAHRLSTVKHADRIYILRNGKITASGKYDELIDTDSSFKTMVELSK